MILQIVETLFIIFAGLSIAVGSWEWTIKSMLPLWIVAPIGIMLTFGSLLAIPPLLIHWVWV